MSIQVLTFPGIGNSGSKHWQSLWEQTNPAFKRVQQRDWDNPVCEEWVEGLDLSVKNSDSDIIIVAHSLACLVVANWANRQHASIKAALLVAVPDPLGTSFPVEAVGFTPVPKEAFPFPSIVVASTNDIYGSLEHSRECAFAWGSQLITIGPAGHINVDSGLGYWDKGFDMLQTIISKY